MNWLRDYSELPVAERVYRLAVKRSTKRVRRHHHTVLIAVVTNIAPHHLDDHGTMEAYVEVKRTIVKYQGKNDLAVLNADNPHTAAMAGDCPHPYLFSRTRAVSQGASVRGDAIVITRGRLQQMIPLGAVQLPGAHTVENALAACLGAALAGASAAAMADVLLAFRGLPYRFRPVGQRRRQASARRTLAAARRSARRDCRHSGAIGGNAQRLGTQSCRGRQRLDEPGAAALGDARAVQHAGRSRGRAETLVEGARGVSR